MFRDTFSGKPSGKTVRASEAILYAIQSQGGEVPAYQFQEWLGELAKRGYVEYDITESSQMVIRLTEKGKAAVRPSKN